MEVSDGLDAASNGNFKTNTPRAASKLIENLVSSNSTKNADLERTRQAANMGNGQIAEVNAKLDMVHSLLVGKKSFRCATGVEEKIVNYIKVTRYQEQRYGYTPRLEYQELYPINSFTKNYESSSRQTPSPNTKESEIKSMLEQILEGQQDIAIDFNGKIDVLYTDLNGKFEALDSHVKKLDIQISQSASSSRGSDTKQH